MVNLFSKFLHSSQQRLKSLASLILSLVFHVYNFFFLVKSYQLPIGGFFMATIGLRPWFLVQTYSLCTNVELEFWNLNNSKKEIDLNFFSWQHIFFDDRQDNLNGAPDILSSGSTSTQFFLLLIIKSYFSNNCSTNVYVCLISCLLILSQYSHLWDFTGYIVVVVLHNSLKNRCFSVRELFFFFHAR